MSPAGRVDPYALGREELAALLAATPEPPEPAYRADQVRRWLARGVDDPERMTDLPARLRTRLAATFAPPPRVLRTTSADGGLTRKVLLDCDGEAVESVLMCYPRDPAGGGRAGGGRATVCVSTQAGCAMGCPFCATGQAGLRRQLTVGQIVRQVTVMQRLLADAAAEVDGADLGTDHVTNVVFMGMGEPLANTAATIAAVRWLAGRGEDGRGGGGHGGFGLSARSITVSTVGLVPGIRRLAALGLPITLAVSLHAPNDELRDQLVPVNRAHPLADLLAACRSYVWQTGRRLTFEYVLIDGINAAPGHAAELAELVVGAFADHSPPLPRPHVNLIPMNPTPAVPWTAPPGAAQRAFAAVLEQAGIAVTIRRNRGADIDAACGQLAADYAAASGRTLPGAAAGRRRLPTMVRDPHAPSSAPVSR